MSHPYIWMFYRWKSLRSTNPGTSKVRLFSSNFFELLSDWLSQQLNSQSEGSSKQLLYRAGLWGSQDLYFLNFFTCKTLQKKSFSWIVRWTKTNFYTMWKEVWIWPCIITLSFTESFIDCCPCKFLALSRQIHTLHCIWKFSS